MYAKKQILQGTLELLAMIVVEYSVYRFMIFLFI
jgi:hypothetical protein